MDSPRSDAPRVWSWAATDGEVAERRRYAAELVGQRIARVRYFTIDYLREQFQPGSIAAGPRLIQDEQEWLRPTWRFDGFDALDFGIELQTAAGSLWSLTWDPPGDREGIGLRAEPMIGSGVAADADVADWDVSLTETWHPLLQGPIAKLELHYVSWDEERSGYWCPRISFVGHAGRVEVLLGDADNSALVPSADNVAVLRPGAELPSWLDAQL